MKNSCFFYEFLNIHEIFRISHDSNKILYVKNVKLMKRKGKVKLL